MQRAHTADTLRTYAEVLYDWFETLEQNAIRWNDADAVDLVAYRNRMLTQPSAHTGRPYRISTINHRVRGVLRFYEWAVRTHWLQASTLAGTPRNFAVTRQPRPITSAHIRAGVRAPGHVAATVRPDGALAALHGASRQRTAAPARPGRHEAVIGGIASHDRGDPQGPQARLRDRAGEPSRRDGGISVRASARLVAARTPQRSFRRAGGLVRQRARLAPRSTR